MNTESSEELTGENPENSSMWQLFENEVTHFSQQYHSYLQLQRTLLPSEFNAQQQMFHGVFPEENKIELRRDGYTILRQVVPLDVIEEAVSFIDSHIQAPALSNVDGAAGIVDGESTAGSEDESAIGSTTTSTTTVFSSAREQRLEQKEHLRLLRAAEKEKRQQARDRIKRDKASLAAAAASRFNDRRVLSLLYGTPVHRLLLSIFYSDAVLASIASPKGSDHEDSSSVIESSLVVKGITSKFPKFRSGTKAEKLLINRLPKQGHTAYRYPYNESAATPDEEKHGVASVNTGGKNWHLDGMLEGKRHPFTLLVGVALSDQMADFSGNLCVFPGTHTDTALQGWLKTFTAAKAEEGGRKGRLEKRSSDEGKELLMAEHGGKPILGEATQVKLQKGDVVLVVQRLAHNGGPNFSQNIRKMAYFRAHHLMVQEVEEMQAAQSVEEEDIWADLEGMRA